jgi:hypothetical protein
VTDPLRRTHTIGNWLRHVKVRRRGGPAATAS